MSVLFRQSEASMNNLQRSPPCNWKQALVSLIAKGSVHFFPSALHNPLFNVTFLTNHPPGSLLSPQHTLAPGILTTLCGRNPHPHFTDEET